MLKAMHKFNQKGFTLIELLIVVAIIAILAAIAIPQFSQYRKRGYNAASNSDLRNMRTGEEAMFADFQDYGTTQAAATLDGGKGGDGVVTVEGAAFYLCGESSATTCQGFSPSPSVSMLASTYVAAAATKSSRFTAGSKHTNGDVIYGVDSILTQPYRKAGVTGDAIVVGDITTPTNTTTNNFVSPTWTPLQ